MALAVKKVDIVEVGPREGCQFEGIGAPDKISTPNKIELVNRLTNTGVKKIEVTSFVSPKAVPQMQDAEAVSEGIPELDDVKYRAVYLNDRGLERAMATGRYEITGKIWLTASETFSKRNQNRDLEQDIAMQKKQVAMYQAAGIPVTLGGIMAAFGCNWEGAIPLEKVMNYAERIFAIAEEAGETLTRFQLADTMGWADPELIKRTVDAFQTRWPELTMGLHLHDTRGTGLANIYAGLEVGVTQFDTSVGGLGGCPFAGTVAGNVATEDVVFMCEQMGVETGIDLDAVVECAQFAEELVGHPLPSKMLLISNRN